MKFAFALIFALTVGFQCMAAKNRFVLSSSGDLQIVDGKVLVELIFEPAIPQFASTVQIWEFATGVDPTPDTSAANPKNNGDLGQGAAAPTHIAADTTISAHFSFDGTDSITGSVTEAKLTYSFWATDTNVWRNFVSAGGTTYVNNVLESFTLSTYVTTGATTQVWGDGLSSALDLPIIWDLALGVSDIESNFWLVATNYGWMAFDKDNRDQWSNTVYVGSFEYNKPADTSGNVENGRTNDATVPGGGSTPTFSTEVWTNGGTVGTNGYFDFDGTDTIIVDNEGNFDFSVNDPFSIACWGYYDSDTDGSLVNKRRLNGLGGFSLRMSGSAKIGFILGGATSGSYNNISVDSVPLGEWIHFVATYDGSDSAAGLKIYTNAVQAVVTTNDTLVGDILGDIEVHIGSRDDTNFRINGRIDSVRIYNTELPATQVTNLLTESTKRHPAP